MQHYWSDTNPSKCLTCGVRKRKDRPQNECKGEPETGRLSFVARSNLYTKHLTAPHASAQTIGKPYTVPAPDARELCARLVLEEALETIAALGVRVEWSDGEYTQSLPKVDDCTFVASTPEEGLDLLDIIDGACDTIYVAGGVLAACGVPDEPHLEEVCRANNDKFPDGRVKLDASGKKYLKPLGWEGPDHKAVMEKYKRGTDLRKAAKMIVEIEKS